MAIQFNHLLLSAAVLPFGMLLTGCNQPTPPENNTSAASPAEANTPVLPESGSNAASAPPDATAIEPAGAADLVEGRDYTVIKTPLTLEKSDQIEVREFFWYGCSHCYALEPSLNNWLATKPVDVNFIRTPAALNPVWEQNARAYYAVEGMGKMTTALHTQLFDTIHQKQQQLFDQKSLASFYSQNGIDLAQFNAAYNSFAVSTKINQSKQLAQRAGLSGVPALVVNGQYLVGGEPQQVIRTINGLIEQQRQALASSTR